MKITFISDIHSNIGALEAVLKDIKKRDIDKIYCLGDLIGYHLFPNEVIDLIKKEEIKTVMGNHEDDIINERFNREKNSDLAKYYNYDILKKENLEFIKNLPFEIVVEESGILFKIVHGSPRNIREYIFEDGENLLEILDDIEEKVLVCAHTHYPYIKKIKDKIVINTGSVGKPKIGRPNASYILFDTDSLNGEIIEVEYDYEKLAHEIEKKNFPQKYADIIRTGKN